MTLFNSAPYGGSSSNTEKLAVFVVNLTALQSTGSTYDADNLDHWRHYVQSRIPVQFESEDDASPADPALDVRSAGEHLANIRQVLDPSISDLASLFGVSRQMIYKWMAGHSEPRDVNLQRIMSLSQTADIFKDAQLDHPGSLLKTKAFNGKCLLDLLKENTDIQEPVKALIAEARKMDAAYQKSGLSDTKASPSSDWQSYVSVPGSSDHS